MLYLKDALRNVMIETGRLSLTDRIDIINVTTNETDWAHVELYVYHERKKKPFIYWNICVNMARNQAYWDKSTFEWLRPLHK